MKNTAENPRHLILEIDRRDDEHFIFNLGFLQAIQTLSQPLELVILSSHWGALRTALDIPWIQLKQVSDAAHSQKTTKFRFLQVFWFWRGLLGASEPLAATWILSAPLFIIISAYLAQWIRREPFFIIVHSDLEKLVSGGLKAKIYRVLLGSLKWKRTTRFVVVSPHILESLREIGWDSRKVRVIEHAIPNEDIPAAGNEAGFVLIGRHAPSANLNTLEGIFANSNLARFTVLGRVPEVSALARFRKQTGWVERSELEAQVQKSKAIVIPYGPTGYRFGASGIVYEALRFLKPIVAFDSAYLRFLKSEGHPIVLIPNDVTKAGELLNQLEADDSLRAELKRQSQAMRLRHLPNAIGKQMSALLEEVNSKS